jgi:hypothetical protein
MSAELKQCPFCGGEVQTSRYAREKEHWTITCPRGKCFLFGFSACGYPTKAEVITAWNTRTSPLVDELVGALEKIKTIAGTIPGKGTLQAADIWNIVRVATDKAHKEIKK